MVAKTNVKLDVYEGALMCPGCKDINLHQRKIEVWERDEDDSKGTHIVVDGSDVIRDDDMSKNPSRRRQGLAIHFHCEYCSYDDKGKPNDKELVLEITQHKGTTYMSWKGYE